MSFTNRLASEKSPYLLQHAHNPVDWYPWGAEAFAKARQEEKPIFLSIGYSTCHWCHVMERESFENEAIARVLNEHFICIKVDREERPDVDRIYMSFVQATIGSGGWPMSVWLTPELKPFVGGTYFPPEDRYGRAGFATVLGRIIEVWAEKREALLAQSEKMTLALHPVPPETREHGELTAAPIRALYQYCASVFDAEWGGFGAAPKFPRPALFLLLLRSSIHPSLNSKEQAMALRMIRETLRAMARGGMHDTLAGGFHRYSVDRFWHVPHFEKMLYDQAQLSVAYLEHWQRSSGGENGSREIACLTLDYVARDLRSEEGGFFSAEDADSLPLPDSAEKIEGAFYVWRQEEIDQLLGEDAALFCQVHNVAPAGNAPEGSDPHGELRGQNVLYQRLGLTSLAKATGLEKEVLSKRLEASRKVLLVQRNLRPRPHRDEKILTSWNGLAISAFARCGAAFGRSDYLQIADQAARFLLKKNRTPEGYLGRSYCGGISAIPAFADDYAFFIQALLDLYEATFDSAWLRQAKALQAEQDAFFLDETDGAYFATRSGATDVIVRLKDDYDGAEPSANSVSASNLLRLGLMTGDLHHHSQARRLLQHFQPTLENLPHSMPQMLVALDLALAAPRQLVLAGDRSSPAFLALAREAHRRFLPHTARLHASDSPYPLPALDGRPTAYLCENFACQLPTTEPEKLARLLDT